MNKRIAAIWLTFLLTFLMVIPASASERILPRLVDGADLLSDSEEAELLAVLDEISSRQQLDVVVVTAESTDGKTPMEYADDFYDYNGYGFGTERDGVLLLISVEERDWWISTSGYGITAFTDAGMNYMSEKFLSPLSDGNYAKAFRTYVELCDDFVTQARTGNPYDGGNLPKEPLSPLVFPVSLGIGFMISYIMGSKKKSSLKSVVKKAEAMEYEVPGSFVLEDGSDEFINKTVTYRVIVEKKEDSGQESSGSTTHTSSSGSTHGGSGGKF